MANEAWIFDFDNHYYEPEDGSRGTRTAPSATRGVWGVDGKRRILVGGTLCGAAAAVRH